MQKLRLFLDSTVSKICASRYFNYMIGTLLVLALLLRAWKIDNGSNDIYGSILKWFNYISSEGVDAFSKPIWDYAFFYPYLLYIKSLFTNQFSIVVIKLISISFDFLMAFYVYRILNIVMAKKPAILFATLFLSIPTVWFNSAVWGQVDGMLCSFFLMSFYYLLKAKYGKAILFFALTTTMKTTFIFFLPFLGLYWLVNRFPLRYFLIIPATYFAMALPALLAGLPLENIFYSFQKQSSFSIEVKRLALNIFNIYTLIDKVDLLHFNLWVSIGVILTFTLLAILTLAIWQKRHFILQKNNQEKALFWLLTLLLTLYIVPMFLPYMHERYYYFTTMTAFLYMVFSISYHTKRPFITWLPFIMLEISSLMTYFKFLYLSYLEIFGPWQEIFNTPLKYFIVPLLLIGLIILCQELSYLLKNNSKNENK